MYFSDEITLVLVSYVIDDIGQEIERKTEKTVFADLTSISGSEVFNAVQGIRPQCRAVIHTADYGGETTVKYAGSNPILEAGTYSVYRNYFNTDTVELYLQRAVGK